jgi:hypothetical protein
VVLGPSRSGKSTLERLLCSERTFKSGLEGRGAAFARSYLEDIAASEAHSPRSASVGRQVFEALFPSGTEALFEGHHEVVTITNPFLLSAAHLIFDLYPNSSFIFLHREAIDNAAEVYARDYSNRYAFAYSPRAALDYVNLYQEAAAILAEKMGHRALRVSYDDLLTSPGSIVKSVCEMLEMPPRNTSIPTVATNTSSVYRTPFLALCSETG